KTLVDLTQENAALKRELEEAQIKAIRAAETAQASPPSKVDAKANADAMSVAGRWNISVTVIMGVLLGALLIGLIAGIWLMDARQRRRLGGFRI
ncbi:MAG: hypothetical protein IT496_07580, partial [Gammaproteobacteria bacterium]|nr:hypothetical protein [Gammaproteobacteria bacterium]